MTRFLHCALVALLAIFWAACPADDDDGGGQPVDGGTDTGSDSLFDSTNNTLPRELVGSWEVQSITVEGTTLTNQSQDLGGAQVRVEGSLDLLSTGGYVFDLTIYEDDVATDTQSNEGTVSLEGDGVVVIDDDANDGPPFRFNYTLSGDTLSLTAADANTEIDALVLRRVS